MASLVVVSLGSIDVCVPGRKRRTDAVGDLVVVERVRAQSERR